VIGEVLKRQNIPAAEVTQFVCISQANQNLITRVAKALGVDASLMFSNVSKYGNTSSASMLIARGGVGAIARAGCVRRIRRGF